MEDFYRGWDDYISGFGDLTGEFWLRSDRIHRLTAARPNSLRVDMTIVKGVRKYAKYGNFPSATRQRSIDVTHHLLQIQETRYPDFNALTLGSFPQKTETTDINVLRSTARYLRNPVGGFVIAATLMLTENTSEDSYHLTRDPFP